MYIKYAVHLYSEWRSYKEARDFKAKDFDTEVTKRCLFGLNTNDSTTK
jgi:hypothetical protein